MEILSSAVRESTRKKFEAELDGSVTLLHFTQGPSRLVLLHARTDRENVYCKQTRQLLEKVAGLSDKIELKIVDFKTDKETAAAYGIDKVPATAILGEVDYGIRIYGIPSGYEYSALIEDIVDVSRRKTGLSDKTKEALKAVDKGVLIQVFVTPTCGYCTLAVRLAHQFAMESPFIRAEMIESTGFPELSNRYNVRGVPKIIINDSFSFEGAVPEEEFLENVLKAVAPIP